MRLAGLAATLAVAAAGTWAGAELTDGFRAFTTESARRLDIERSPRPVPTIAWRDAQLDHPPAGDRGAAPVRIVDFIYTRCPTVCRSAGDVYAMLARELAGEIDAGRVELLSVGFDLEHDTPEALDAYRRRSGGGVGWRALAPATEADLRVLTDAFGVYIRPDGQGGFVHNAALSVTDPAGRLVAVHDLEEWRAAAASAREFAAKSRAH